MDIHGYPWIPNDIHGYTWISMGFHGFPWVSMESMEILESMVSPWWGVWGAKPPSEWGGLGGRSPPSEDHPVLKMFNFDVVNQKKGQAPKFSYFLLGGCFLLRGVGGGGFLLGG